MKHHHNIKAKEARHVITMPWQAKATTSYCSDVIKVRHNNGNAIK